MATSNGPAQETDDDATDKLVAPFRLRLKALTEDPLTRCKKDLLGLYRVQEQALAQLLDEFSTFAGEYFDFFAHIQDARKRREYLPKALRQLQQEAELLLRASQQRLVPGYQLYLRDADAIARRIYRRFKGEKQEGSIVPLIFVEKQFTLRRFVYAQRSVPLLAIPMLALNDKKLQAGSIAHEMGHFICTNVASLVGQNPIASKLEQTVLETFNIHQDSLAAFGKDVRAAELFVGWIEEIVADALGACLIGPHYVITAFKMAADEGARLTQCDPEHPLSYLRPLIALEALEWVFEHGAYDPAFRPRLAKLIAALRAHWRVIAEQARAEEQAELAVPGEDLEPWVRPVVYALLNVETGRGTQPAAQPKRLGDRFGYDAWLAGLEDVSLAPLDEVNQAYDYASWLDQLPALEQGGLDAGEEQVMPSKEPAGAVLGKASATLSAFQQRLDAIKGECGGDEAKICARLLGESLGKERGNEPFYAYVQFAGSGNGDYDVVGMV